MKRKILVSVPATSANLGPGYDCLGVALTLRHEVVFEVLDQSGLKIAAEGEDSEKIPLNTQNLVFQSAMMIFDKLDWHPDGLSIHQMNQIPIGSGLGSSSSAVLAGMFGANALAGSPYSVDELLQMATDFEGHPDNVAPAVHGGLILGVQNGNGLFVERIPVPPMSAVIVLPEFELSTADARAVLPPTIPRSAAIFNASRLGLLIRAFQSGEYQKLSIAMHDQLHQPYRIPLIPGMREALAAAQLAGASGVALSGAGPSLIAFTPNKYQEIAQAAIDAFRNHGLNCRTWTLTVDPQGILVQEL